MTDLDHGADLRERLDRAVTGLDAPAQLTPAVLADGRRLRRRRRLVASGAGLAATAAVTTLVVTTLGSGAPSTGPAVATDPPATPQASERQHRSSGVPSPGADAPGTAFPDTPPGWWDMPATTMAEELSDLLPDGMRLTDAETTNTDRAPGEPEAELQGYLTAVLRPAEGGPGKVNLVLFPPTSGEPVPPPETDADGNVTMYAQDATAAERTSCDPEWVTRPRSCTQLRDAGGRPIGRVLDSTANGVRSLSVDLLTADGGVVMVNVANTLADKWPAGATPSAADVPLDLAGLRAIASDPVWTSYAP